MENLKTLTGKYGEEGDRLIFKILNSGDFTKGIDQQDFNENNLNKLSFALCEKALRYDLTVPFARFVVQHQNEIAFPFRRFQIQPVWRADRPQKGRYREFYQCDADMIGSDSLENELELISLMNDVFSDIGLNTIIKVNNRKILSGIAEVTGEHEHLVDITVAMDKLDKIGEDEVIREMLAKGVSQAACEKIRPLLRFQGNDREKMTYMREYLKGSEIGQKGLDELEWIWNNAPEMEKSALELDITLARGLNYYTGAIFEVKAVQGSLSSTICGGGRYDDLTGIFGLKGMSGVGISFGADRIYDVMDELGLFPEETLSGTRIIFMNFGTDEAAASRKVIGELRKNGISAELYPDSSKPAKQFKYADQRRIPYVGIIGADELSKGVIQLKNLSTGEQKEMQLQEIISTLA